MAFPAPEFVVGMVLSTLGATDFAGQSNARLPDSEMFNGVRASAGYSTSEALTGRWQEVSIFVVQDTDGRTSLAAPALGFVAKRQSGEQGMPGNVTWASSGTCPALRNTLVWLTTLIAPRIEIAGITPAEYEPAGRRPVRMTVDGTATTVWGRGTQPDYTQFTRVEISSNGGLVADFGQSATSNLASCWGADEPAY